MIDVCPLNELKNVTINDHIPWLNPFQWTAIEWNIYISLWAYSDILSVEVQVFLEAFFSSGIKNSSLDGSSIWRPIDEDHFADGHFVTIYEFKIEHAVSVFLVGKWVYELLPSLLFSAYPFNKLI